VSLVYSGRLLLAGLLLVGAQAQGVAQSGDHGTWSRAAPMPTERGEVGAAVVDSRIYVVGAYSGATDANEAYDPLTNS
jgi:hypothetical protein